MGSNKRVCFPHYRSGNSVHVRQQSGGVKLSHPKGVNLLTLGNFQVEKYNPRVTEEFLQQ